MCLCLGVGFAGFILKKDKVLCTYFARSDMNDLTIPHAFVLRKTLCTTSSVSERGDMDSEKPQCNDPEHQITLCEINTTENIDGYIIKFKITIENSVFITYVFIL